MKRAIIDIGSNTVKMEIFEEKVKLLTEKSAAGLACYIEHDVLSDKAISLLIDILARFKQICTSLDIHAIYPFATAAIRNVNNTQEILTRIKEQLDLEIKVLSGEEEAVFAFRALMNNFSEAVNGIMVDVGGGSTEIVRFEERIPVHKISLPIGSLNLYKNCVSGVLPKSKEIEKISGIVKEHIKEIKWLKNVNGYGYIIGGTGRAFAKINQYMHETDTIAINGYKCDSSELAGIIKKKKEIRDLILLNCPDRIHTFFPGVIILNAIFRNVETICISSTGVRNGFFEKIFE